MSRIGKKPIEIPNGVEVLTLRKDEDFPRIITH